MSLFLSCNLSGLNTIKENHLLIKTIAPLSRVPKEILFQRSQAKRTCTKRVMSSLKRSKNSENKKSFPLVTHSGSVPETVYRTMTLTSTVGLWTRVLHPQIWHFGCNHLDLGNGHHSVLGKTWHERQFWYFQIPFYIQRSERIKVPHWLLFSCSEVAPGQYSTVTTIPECSTLKAVCACYIVFCVPPPLQR